MSASEPQCWKKKKEMLEHDELDSGEMSASGERKPPVRMVLIEINEKSISTTYDFLKLPGKVLFTFVRTTYP